LTRSSVVFSCAASQRSSEGDDVEPIPPTAADEACRDLNRVKVLGPALMLLELLSVVLAEGDATPV